MLWQIIESGPLAPEAIMQKDFHLLRDFQAESSPLLHFYEWDCPCLTYGYFIKPSDYLNLEALGQYGLKLARRPTGGGIIFHTTDFAFSVFIPANHPEFSTNTLENYALVNQRVAKAIQAFTNNRIEPALLYQPLVETPHLDSAKAPAVKRSEMGQYYNMGPFPIDSTPGLWRSRNGKFQLEAGIVKEQVQQAKENSGGFCMATPTQFDLIIEGKKVGGAAQRRTKKGLLHQGSISLGFPSIAMLGAVLKNHTLVASDMEKHSYCLLKESAKNGINEGRRSIKKFIQYYVAEDQ